uniref:Uncharacterized protein n=1 Tax=Chromera velia CCMP2878 TaxID=1169474 RepID=A0A0G4HLT6_9ALVE|eukprot:Cvel_28879.t1-p1 / transcript=Cvel_28879.t1 / gene=Cvel_28879 / organism=Chromera_velia_CCMP2878 / gene_product=hypothetical protein / transcript_product=hypothetical protein / location=Cvel_scaffold3860:12351-12608(-) / protein_length=86 / sequence_SO=supercontig / SO=protein_coding / is_pseudo=false
MVYSGPFVYVKFLLADPHLLCIGVGHGGDGDLSAPGCHISRGGVGGRLVGAGAALSGERIAVGVACKQGEGGGVLERKDACGRDGK